jgi:rhodanese-related sulfurtransferase
MARRHTESPVLDVRTPAEYARGHLAGAINVDVTAPDFQERLDALVADGTLNSGEPVYLYCRSGNRSGRAASILRDRGFDDALNVGGFQALRAAGAKTHH